MDLEITKQRIYGPKQDGKPYFFQASIGSQQIATAPTREQAKEKAIKVLASDHEYIGSLSAARIAKDGTILIVREIAKGCAQVEYNRNGKSGSLSLGAMSDGYKTFTDIQSYADYLLGQYQGEVAK